MDDLPRVVYIAGYGRSGSTLLDALLGSHEAIVGGGELVNLFSRAASGGACACGERVAECPFWSKVLDRVRSDLPELSWEDADAITRHRDGVSTLRRSGGTRIYAPLWRSVFAAISEIGNARVIVDSSKTSHDAYRRPVALASAGLTVSVVHLVRDPRAIVWARLRWSRPLVGGRAGSLGPDIPPATAVRTVSGWMAANRAVRDADILLRYEDLVAEPREVLRKLQPVVGEDLGPVIDHLDAPVDPGHGIGGSRWRSSGPVHISPDLAWKTELPSWARSVAALAASLARRYGY